MLNDLYFHISSLRIVGAEPNMTVLCTFLVSRFHGMSLRYFLNYFEMVSVHPVITGIIFDFILRMPHISILSSVYFRIISASFFNTFPYLETATSITIQVLLSLLLLLLLLSSSSLSCCLLSQAFSSW